MRADNQLAAAIATMGSTSSDALEPGLSASSFGMSSLTDFGTSNLTGGPALDGLVDSNGTPVAQLPGSLITIPGSPVNIIDVVSGGGVPLDSKLGSSETPNGIALGAAALPASGFIGDVTTGVAAVPEPASLLLLGGGLVAAGAKRRKARRGLGIY